MEGKELREKDSAVFVMFYFLKKDLKQRWQRWNQIWLLGMCYMFEKYNKFLIKVHRQYVMLRKNMGLGLRHNCLCCLLIL